jgi:hypothetical protein
LRGGVGVGEADGGIALGYGAEEGGHYGG